MKIESQEILNVRVDEIKEESFEELLDFYLQKKSFSKIFTINPEFIVESYYNTRFKEVLNSSDFNSQDGVGVLMSFEFLKYRQTLGSFLSIVNLFRILFQGHLGRYRLTGVSITLRILEYANKHQKSVYFLGGNINKKVDSKMQEFVVKNFPNINVYGSSSSFSSREDDDQKTIDTLHDFISRKEISGIDFLFVGYGHPKQEFWIERNQSKIPAKVAIGVGGTFDFLVGVVPRSPKWLQNIGMEWFFRLIIQPKRAVRIFRAVFIYPILFIYSLIKK